MAVPTLCGKNRLPTNGDEPARPPLDNGRPACIEYKEYLELLAITVIAYSSGSRYTGLLNSKTVPIGVFVPLCLATVTSEACLTTVVNGIITDGDG